MPRGKKGWIVGERHELLVVLDPLSHGKVRVRCDCGTEKTIERANLGKQKSCGCVKGGGQIAHGHCVGGISPAYASWRNMVQRCTDPKTTQWKDYGGRGITIHPEWMAFEAFLRDVGEPTKPGLSIDRIKNDRGYVPGNVKWSTRQEQCRNRRTNCVLELDGEKRTAVEWSLLTGLSQSLIYQRLKLGWPVDRTLKTPARRCVRRAA